MAHSVPIIDITGLRSGDLAERTRVAREIGGACETIGFFGITGHGVDPRLLDDVFDATRRVFDLPKEEKMAKAWDDDHVNRGYDPAGNQALDEGTPPDLKEAWAFSPENSAGSSPMQGENQWPDLDEVRTPVTAYHAAAMELGALMLRAMALSLGLAEGAPLRPSSPPARPGAVLGADRPRLLEVRGRALVAGRVAGGVVPAVDLVVVPRLGHLLLRR